MKEKRKGRAIYVLIWVLAFALVNYPIGAWASNKLEPFILGLPFSVCYFWVA